MTGFLLKAELHAVWIHVPCHTRYFTSEPSRFFGDDLAVAPEINGCAVEAGGLAGHQGGAAQRASGAGKGVFVFTVSRLHLWTEIVADCLRNYRTLSTRPPAVCR